MIKEEKETIIVWNELDPMADVFTYSKPMQRRFRLLGIEPFMDNGYGGLEYHIDKGRIKIRAERKKRKISKELKAKLVNNIKKAREVRMNGEKHENRNRKTSVKKPTVRKRASRKERK